MDSNSNAEKTNKKKFGNIIFNDGNVFSTIWIRCTIQTNTRFDKFLLDYGFRFLLPFGSIFYIILLFCRS